ncbi:hypothetical protein H6788_02080 [Candidatus Nomurabacteria bacterium]|nr:hypothetical protein [Candidatus Nomurabacteria bacterium]
MPHIYPLFRADDNEVRAILKENKTKFRELVSQQLGYSMEDIAVIPKPIAAEDADLADNILRLEFVIDTGSRTVGEVDVHKQALKADFGNSCDLNHINFGIWIRPFEHSGFVEHKPIG